MSSSHERTLRICGRILVALAACLAAAGLPVALAVVHCGPACDETWTTAQNPHILGCSTYVPDVCFVTIEAGVEVRAQGMVTALEILGTLTVTGTVSDPVVFTSDMPSPAAGDWIGITVSGTATATLEHAEVHYAQTGIAVQDSASLTLDQASVLDSQTGIAVQGPASATLTGATVSDNTNGILVESDATFTASTSAFTANQGYGLSIDGPAVVNVTDSEIHSNLGEFDVVSHGGYDIIHMMRGNWWGTTDPVAIDARIDDHVGPTIDWCGYLDGPGGVPAADRHCLDLFVCDETLVLDQTDRPYHLVNYMQVCETATLRIEAGVEIRAPAVGPGAVIAIQGNLEVVGTEASPVIFTSDADVPQPGDWGGVAFSSTTATVSMSQASVTYAYNGLAAGVTSTSVLDHVTSAHNMVGLELSGDPDLTATNCAFTDNDDSGVVASSAYPNTSVSITRSSIHGNHGSYDLDLDGLTPGTVLHARENWWGTTDPAAIESRVRDLADFTGDEAFPWAGTADWCDYLDGPPDTGTSAMDLNCPDLLARDGTLVWDLTDKPYHLVSTTLVQETGTLQIGPGVEIAAVAGGSGKPGIAVRGVLDVDGTEPSPVVMHSDAASPQAGDWYGLWFLAAATGTIDRTTILHADHAIDADGGANVTLNGVTAQSSTDGLYVQGDGPPTVTAWACEFTANQSYGVEVSGTSGAADPAVNISGSSIHGNLGSYDFYAATNFASPITTVLEARGNWWGSDDPSVISQRIHDRSDNNAAARVEWCAWLDGPGGTAPDVHCPETEICDETVIWDQTDWPYQITGNTYVCPTGVLQVQPGVEVRSVKADPVLTFSIDGTLQVSGTEAEPVLFTSDSETPAAGDWSGLRFSSVTPSELTQATVEYGNDGIYVDDDATITLTGVTLRYNVQGIDARSIQGRPTVTADDSAIVANTGSGVFISETVYHPYPVIAVHHSQLHTNGAYAFTSATMGSTYRKVVDFRENWWGSPDPDVFGPTIFDYRQSNNRPIVDFCRYLDAPGGSPVVDAHCPDLAVCDETVTLDLTDKPYQVTSDMYVCPTGTLEVKAGVTVMTVAGTPRSDIQVHGALQVNGTEGSPVVFTSDAATPQPNDWTGLYLASSSVSSIDQADVSHAYRGVEVTGSATATLTGVKSWQNHDGVRVFGYGPPGAALHECELTDNDNLGIAIGTYTGRPTPSVTVNRSSIYGNRGSYDYSFGNATGSSKTVADARDNWWGSADPAAIGPRIYDHRSNGSAPMVDWCGWLDAPGGVAVRQAHCPDLAACDETVVLDQTDLPYLLTSDMIVCDTGTLQVEPGVELRTVVTTPQPDFLIQGTLDVNGTPGSPAHFTSDGDTPQVGDWIGLVFEGSAIGTLENAEINWADTGLRVDGSSNVTLDGVAARFNQDGMYLFGYGPPSATATNCTFTDNTRYGIRAGYYTGRPNPGFSINRSSLHSNGGDYDLHFGSAGSAAETAYDARDNWWGSADPAVIGPRIHDHRTSASSPIVDWCGWLDGPDGEAAREAHCLDLAPCDETVVADQADLPYLLTSDLIICDTGVLQLEPGVELRTILTTPASDFVVQGTLDVNGTKTAPVTLTSDAASPAVGDWYGVLLEDSSTSTLAWAVIEWADHGIEMIDNATVALDGVTLQHNYDGLWMQGYGQQTATAAGCAFTDNDRYGIYARRITGYPNPDLTVTRSSLHSNAGSHDLYTADFASPATSIVWATDNWWGTTDEDAIALRIRDYSDESHAPLVYYKAFGDTCEMALAGDLDHDGLPDFLDNCPLHANASQYDYDGDGMGDPCDPVITAPPTADCDGSDDWLKGYADADNDGWGDPCDPQPCRDDSYPGAVERCDGRDNDGDGFLGPDERADEDLDLGLLCGDCDETDPAVNVCGCEECGNLLDDDCDGFPDAADDECIEASNCVFLAAGSDPWLSMVKGECGGATVAGPYDVIRGQLATPTIDAGHVDLGEVSCVQGAMPWDRVTDWSLNPNPRCATSIGHFYLGRNTGDPDFGQASSGEPRDVTTPDPVCP